MKTAAKIFLRDLRRILRNPVAVVVTLGVCVIPSLYAWFNILANWDPYNNTSTVPVAVVNEDQGANAGSRGFVNAGDMVVERLSQNDQLGWDFTDEGAAREGVGSGRYYAAIIIPPTSAPPSPGCSRERPPRRTSSTWSTRRRTPSPPR